MQVLSQLSYNPTIGPLIGVDIGRHPGRLTAARRASSGPAIAGLHHPGSLRIEADAYCSRVNAFGAEYIRQGGEPRIGGLQFGMTDVTWPNVFRQKRVSGG